MQTVEDFLAHAIRLEQEAATRYGELAQAMQGAGNFELARLFRQLAEYSELHLGDAKARAGSRALPTLSAAQFRWPGPESPESAALRAVDPLAVKARALEVALAAEQAGHDFYKSVLTAASDPEIKALAEDFVIEEAEHVAELKRWIAADKAGLNAPA